MLGYLVVYAGLSVVKVRKTSLETHPFLLFIDNFETVEDESVLEFVDNLPGATLSPGHKVVVTSRHRILGRQIRLEGLADWEAAKLIKETAKYFGVRKVFADPETQNRVIQETGSVPLALRWVVGQVSLDRSVGDVLSKMSQRVSDIHKFCFDATVAELDTPHLKLLYVLSQLDDPVDEETVANISGLTVEDVGRSLMTLLKYSLVSRKVEQVWETELYQLLPLTATYCAGLGSRWPKYSDEVAERAGVQTQRQRTRAVANGIFKRYRAFTEDDRVAVSAATEALVEYNQRDDLEKALQMLDDAEAMGPTLGYPYLARAQILAQEDRFKEARSYFEKALDRDPQNVDILRNWGELELSTGKYPEAVDLIEQGCQLSPSDVGLRLLLAKATMKNAQLSGTKGHKKERNTLLRDALRHAQAAILDSVNTQSEKRHNLECYEVQIEIYLKQDRPDRALEACQEGLALDPDDFTLKTLEPSVRSAVDASDSSE
jgi:tetratricopeptide (TPR) repeat protein